MNAIVIPLHHGGGKFGDDTELRYTLRSIARHFVDPFEVVIVGKKLPSWLRGVRHLPCTGGLKTALKVAAEAYPDGFFWLYDDCTLVRDTTAAEMKVTGACKGWRGSPRTGWARGLETIRKRLVEAGLPAHDYSRPHGPYWFDKGMIDEAFVDWPTMAGKFPFESWILSKRDWPRRHGVVKQYYGPFQGPPADQHWFLNHNGKGLSSKLMDYLQERFPSPSLYEVKHDLTWPPVRRKLEVHTLRLGDPWWLQLCAPTLDAWCAKHGHPLRIWADGDINPAYPAAKFCEVDMLKEFLAGDAEWLLYVDADVYVDDVAPPHPCFEGKTGVLIRNDLPGRGPGKFAQWCRRHKREAAGWEYRNAGVWACDRDGARRMLEVISEPYIEGWQEQHQWNHWLSLASAAGMQVEQLPAEWNNFPADHGRGAFYHIAGKEKEERLATFRADGRIPKEGELLKAAGAQRGRNMEGFSVYCVVLSPEHFTARREGFFESLRAHGGFLNELGVDWWSGSKVEDHVIPSFPKMRKNPHYWAATCDHLDIIQHAILKKYDYVFIFEDDARFTEDFEVAFWNAWQALPDRWRAMRLGWDSHQPGGTIKPGVLDRSPGKGVSMLANVWSREGLKRAHDHFWHRRKLIIDWMFADLRQLEPAHFYQTTVPIVTVAKDTLQHGRAGEDAAPPVIACHGGGGLFSHVNKVVTVMEDRSTSRIAVDWTDAPYYAGEGNLFDQLFEPLSPCVPGAERIVNYPHTRYTGIAADSLYGDESWRLRLNQWWTQLRVREDLRAEAEAFLADHRPAVALHVRNASIGGECRGGLAPSMSDYARAVEGMAGKIFLATDNEECLNFFRYQLGDRLVFRDIRRSPNMRTELHKFRRNDHQDARDCLVDALVMAGCAHLVHSVSNIATAVLYMNPEMSHNYVVFSSEGTEPPT